MRAVVTRVSGVRLHRRTGQRSEYGMACWCWAGVGPQDTEEVAQKLADKICNLRVFEDENGKMNLNLEQGWAGAAGGEPASPCSPTPLPPAASPRRQAGPGRAPVRALHGLLPSAGLRRPARGIRRLYGGGLLQRRARDHSLRHGPALTEAPPMLFFHRDKPAAPPPGASWYWTLTVDGMPAVDFDWPAVERGLERLRPDRDSFVALERMDPNDPGRPGSSSAPWSRRDDSCWSAATPERRGRCCCSERRPLWRRSAPRSGRCTARRERISPAFPTCPTPSGRTDREVIP